MKLKQAFKDELILRYNYNRSFCACSVGSQVFLFTFFFLLISINFCQCLKLFWHNGIQDYEIARQTDRHLTSYSNRLCQGAKILPIHARCSVCLEMSGITVIYEKYFELDCISQNYLENSELNCSTA